MAARSSPLIQATRSPAIRPTSQFQIDPSRHGEYPVILGEKLANGTDASSNRFYGIRYNYKSKNSSSKQTTTIKQGASNRTFDLNIDDFPEGRDPISFKYQGSVDPKSSASDRKPTALALVFDQDKQVFVVEPISAELNFNLVAGPGQLRQYPQLPVLDALDDDEIDQQELFGEGGSSAASEDEGPDSNNPFDYRHFMEQARATTNIITENKLGASPSIQPQSSNGKFLTTSKSTSSPAVTAVTKPKPRPANTKASSQNAVKAPPSRSTAKSGSTKSKSKLATTSKQNPKSAAVITASDEDSDDEMPLASQAPANPKIRVSQSKATNHGYSSPQVVFDEASGLEIDMGSPPPIPRNRGRIDPSEFASRSPSNSLSANQSPANPSDDESDEDMEDVQDNGDSDVEALTLPPPKADTRRLSSSAPRRVSTEQQPVGGEVDAEDEDEDDQAFAAMMEQELAQEEESEVSEEE